MRGRARAPDGAIAEDGAVEELQRLLVERGRLALGACSWNSIGSSEPAATAAPAFYSRRLGSLYGACAALVAAFSAFAAPSCARSSATLGRTRLYAFMSAS